MRERDVSTDTTDEQPEDQPKKRGRRLIDYPRRGRRGFTRWLPSYKLVIGLFLFFCAAVTGAFFIALAVVTIPQPNDFATRQATIFDYADGKTQIAHVGTNRVSVPLSAVPPVVRSAVLAAEDRSFYGESGVSPTGILRALKNDVTGSSGDIQGGSTITQQYVKNYYLTQQQTVGRKLDEALISIKIDEQVPKDTILQNYLNTIFFGRNAYGIEAAARAYFGESIGAVANDPAKAAYLASLIQSPYYFSTAGSDPTALKGLQERWNYVLDGMVAEHWLDRKVRAKLVFPAPVTYRSNDLAGTNGYLVNAATQYLERQHKADPNVPSAEEIAQGGYTVVTTFRPEYLTAVRDAVTEGLSGLDPAHNPADANVHMGVAAVDQSTGALLGFYGGPDYLKQGFDDALQAAGPMGKKVSQPLVFGASVGHQDWGSTVALLGDLGINDAHPNDNPPADDDLSATPVRAAAAFTMSQHPGRYAEPYEVSEVLQDGRVVWQASPPAPATPSSVTPNQTRAADGNLAGNPAEMFQWDRSFPAIEYNGHDGSEQWSWTIGSTAAKAWPPMPNVPNVSIAVDMYATGPNGKGNKVLSGMTPPVLGPPRATNLSSAGQPTIPMIMVQTGSTNADRRTSAVFGAVANSIVRQQSPTG